MEIIKIRAAKEEYKKLYCDLIEMLNNNLSLGFFKDENNNYVIAARLQNENGKMFLPTTFHGFQVEIVVVGDIKMREANS